MKASLKFREEQKPLFRAKVPLTILGLPFQSGIVAGESKELTLNLSTFFESGPSIKIAYRPNDVFNPFSLVVKTGMGAFGSPISSSLLMSAEFNLLSIGNPSFMLHFKPKFGDFSIKKSQSSSAFDKNGNWTGSLDNLNDDGSIEVVDSPVLSNGLSEKKIRVLPQPTASAIVGAFSGVEVTASTKLPVRSRAMMNFRWGVRVPAEIKSGSSDSMAGINFRNIPFLVMNKIGIEHVDSCDDSKSKGKVMTPLNVTKLGSELRNVDMAEACLSVKKQMEVLQAENGLLKKAVDDLRQEISGRLSFPVADSNAGRHRDIERNAIKNGGGSRVERRSNEKKAVESDVNEELKKALKGNVGVSGA
ncbi:uncharacterized protein LOC8266978 [Ricinus communis]|uniref:uncharacterized protein LOC8266978 n=1 Tax=Ricinus communis TaxID=3988 RepID=UPI00201AF7B3|nr:uncharacterized protein LOC8266978 [Ricinus communis]XP_025014595.2 uncharacterized protein LOC8266978 [Ricinus communis]XP_048234081.1 uncharacterized protein LOC8266978 [Ricinus communis]XP_048234082.1 uncharacterized protein LOC8266978 [Ricinus communis]